MNNKNSADLYIIPTCTECWMFSCTDKLRIFALPA
jgi:hypothetical protein